MFSACGPLSSEHLRLRPHRRPSAISDPLGEGRNVQDWVWEPVDPESGHGRAKNGLQTSGPRTPSFGDTKVVLIKGGVVQNNLELASAGIPQSWAGGAVPGRVRGRWEVHRDRLGYDRGLNEPWVAAL